MEKVYQVLFNEAVKKDLKKLDKFQAKLIKKWIVENLINQSDPRKSGKALKGNLHGLWRYRVGAYRIIAEIKDSELIILVIEIGHRKDAYSI